MELPARLHACDANLSHALFITRANQVGQRRRRVRRVRVRRENVSLLPNTREYAYTSDPLDEKCLARYRSSSMLHERGKKKVTERPPTGGWMDSSCRRRSRHRRHRTVIFHSLASHLVCAIVVLDEQLSQFHSALRAATRTSRECANLVQVN